MWKEVCSRTYQGVEASDIWRIWTNVNEWAQWHDDLDYCQMEGSFEVGNYFMLKPKGMQPVKIILTDVKLGVQFTDCTTFFGAKMFDTHLMERTPNGLKLTNIVVVTGPLQWLWVKLVAKNIARGAPDHLEALAKLARRQHG